jgi:hypothetical protein
MAKIWRAITPIKRRKIVAAMTALAVCAAVPVAYWLVTLTSSVSSAGTLPDGSGTQGINSASSIAAQSSSNSSRSSLLTEAHAACPAVTHSLTVTKIGSVSGTAARKSTFGPWNQHVVSTPNGIFAVYFYTHDVTTLKGYWRLRRSTDGGRRWTTVYDSAADGSTIGQSIAVGVDADPSGNVYVVSGANYNDPTYFYRFSASNYSSHLRRTLQSTESSPKFSMAYNPTYKQIDLLWWYEGTRPSFLEINPNGTIARSEQLWSGTPSWAHPEYGNLELGPNGEIFAGWFTNDSSFRNGPQDYYDAQFLASSDNGRTWQGENGTVSLPIATGETGPAYEIVNTADPTEFISHNSSSYGATSGHYDYNQMNSFAFNNDALHFEFNGPDPKPHQSYVQLAWPGRSFSNRKDRWRTADGHSFTDGDGSFTQPRGYTGTLYWLGRTWARSSARLIAADSPDGGTTWCTYAMSSWTSPGALIRYVDAARFTNGHILGVFTRVTGWNRAVVYFVTDRRRPRHRRRS